MLFQYRVNKFFPRLGKWISGRESAGQTPRPPVVAIFGKHPGWSDHISLPLPTAALGGLWQMIYNTGIRSIIERGIWSQLSEAELIPFGHLFLWGQRRSWIVGRMWASTDKVGRRDYPMVACVDFEDASFAKAIDFAAPILRELESACRQSKQSADVLSGLETARGAAIQWKAEDPPAAPFVEQPPAAIGSHPDLNGLDQPLFRVLLPWADLLDRGIGQKIFSRQTVTAAAPVRVPMCAATPEAAMKLWAQFCAEIAGPRYSLFVAAADGQPWVDVMLGQPGAADLAVLRRSAQSFKAITDLPDQEYPPSFHKWASAKLR